AAAGASFGLHGTQGIKTIGGLTQIARKGTGSADMTFTAVERILSNVMTHSDKLRGAGVKVYEGKGASKHTRDLPDILIDTISKVGGSNIEQKNKKLESIFGEEGIRGIKPLLSAYQTAF